MRRRRCAALPTSSTYIRLERPRPPPPLGGDARQEHGDTSGPSESSLKQMRHLFSASASLAKRTGHEETDLVEL